MANNYCFKTVFGSVLKAIAILAIYALRAKPFATYLLGKFNRGACAIQPAVTEP
jgi:hypothetical protein